MRKPSGFTLIEMIIVISIISLVSAALLPRIRSYKDRASNAVAMKNMSDVNYALAMYYDAKGSYPAATTCSNGVKTDCSLSSINSLLSEYIRAVPQTSYSMPANWSFGSGYLVPIANQYGYVGLGTQYIFTYHAVDTRDAQQYRVITMPDGQTWLAENLNYTTNNSVCYNNDPAQCGNDYGRLYTWNDAQTACTPGRHLATVAEWAALTSKIGSTAGSQLKSTQNGGTDLFGFSVLLAGKKFGGNSYNDRNADGYYRTTQSLSTTDATAIKFDGTTIVIIDTNNKNTYFSIRCIKD